jgi:glycosyltransferase involved in cell wall biosynthesis
MKVLFLSNLFPDESEPYRGLDNATLLHHLAPHCELRVVSPRPVLPLVTARRAWASRPADACFEPLFPPVPYVPKIGSRFNHRLFARGIRETLLELRLRFPFEVILVSWAYPDGCATDLLVPELGVPFVVITQGSDVHAYLRIPVRRKLITAAMSRASGVITRSADLSRQLAGAGVAEKKLRTIYNGVDLSLFHPADPVAARKELGLPVKARVILFVGNFLPVKNPLLLVRAHAELCRLRPEARPHLVMVGGGSLEQQARAEANALGSGDRVLLAGRKLPEQVARYMQAADVLALSSENEGVPNVVLEAFASGLPVVATNVGGIHEVLGHDFLGRLVDSGQPAALARALHEALNANLELQQFNCAALAGALAEVLDQLRQTEQIVGYAQGFSWDQSAKAYLEMLEGAVAKIGPKR